MFVVIFLVCVGIVSMFLWPLTSRYKDVVDFDLITVWTFTEKEQVSSFRSAAPSETFLKLVDKVWEMEISAPTPWTTTGSGKRKSRSLPVGDRRGSDRATKDGGAGEEDGTDGLKDGKISKQEARRLKKEKRKAEVNYCVLWIG